MSTNHRQTSDTGELVSPRSGRYEHLVLDINISCQGDVVGDNHSISQSTVMRNVRICHKKTARADDRLRTGLGTSVNCYTFADTIVRTDSKLTRALDEAEILRLAA